MGPNRHSLLALPASAQSDFPTRPIKIVVPYSPGSGSDVLARTIAQGITERTGKAVIVENRDAGGEPFTFAVAKLATSPDVWRTSKNARDLIQCSDLGIGLA